MFAEMDKPTEKKRVRVGQPVTAKVVVIGTDNVFVDLGAKAEGMIDRAELTDDDGELTVAVGDSVTATVVSTSGGTVVLKTKVGRADGADALKHALDARLPVSGTV